MATTRHIGMTVNGERHEAEVEPRTTLVDFLRMSVSLCCTNGCRIRCRFFFKINSSSDVKSEIHHIPIHNHIFLSFDP